MKRDNPFYKRFASNAGANKSPVQKSTRSAGPMKRPVASPGLKVRPTNTKGKPSNYRPPADRDKATTRTAGPMKRDKPSLQSGRPAGAKPGKPTSSAPTPAPTAGMKGRPSNAKPGKPTNSPSPGKPTAKDMGRNWRGKNGR